MFFDVFKSLCDEKGISCKRATIEMGLSNSISTKWKRTGATPNGETLNIIADFFGVTTDYLLGQETEKTPTPQGERPISFDDFTYAMYEESKDLTEENKQKLLEMAQFFRQQQEKDKQK